MSYRPGTKVLMSALALLLAAVAAFMIIMIVRSSAPEQQAAAARVATEQYLSASSEPKAHGFRIQDVPSWLFIHVAAIAAIQIVSIIAAGVRANSESLTSGDIATVQFLVEIPMYLGLFGTLLGVTLTQFITGSLVAPLAYLTTMSGIVLHVIGKLAILLPLRLDQRAVE